MSGAEVLGIVASATQLAAYSIKIVLHLDALSKELRNIPNRTRQHIRQVKELIETTTLIEQNKSLRSPKIHEHLQSTLFEAQTLFNVLRDLSNKYAGNTIWRYWAILQGVGEKEILASFDKLEREKSALRLCISLIHTDLIVGVQSSIDRISGTGMPTQSGNHSAKSYTAGSSAVGSTGNTGPRTFRIIGDQKIPLNMKPQDQAHGISQEKTAPTVQSSTRITGSDPHKGHTYGNVNLTENARGVNGNQNGNGWTAPSRDHTYGEVSASGSSSYVNGDQNGNDAIEKVHGKR